MSSWARVGAECICVRDTPWIDGETLTVSSFGPIKDEYLVIERVVAHPEHGIGLGFTTHHEADGRPSIYPIAFFRPLILQGSDVALFAHHLDLVGEPA
jgi:hypothetical protein